MSPAAACPKCAFVLSAPADSCPKCGVVFSKVPPTRRALRSKDVVVSTGDIRGDYEVLGPVFFAVSNKGLFSSQLDELTRKHGIPATGSTWSDGDIGWAFLAGEWPVGHQQFPRGFLVCIEELKLQTLRLGGDGVIWLRQDVDLDTSGFQFFYMQAYGTAIRRR